MLLAVDIGNTQTHLGAFRGEELIEHWRFQTRSGATGDELGERIAGFFNLSSMDFDDIDSVCVSSVVPPLGNQYERMTERYLEADCLTIGPGVKSGMPIRIDNPLEVGADRLVNAIAAYERFGDACVVVDFGTGINIDAVSADGAYLGGAIGPGLEISLTALIDRAARITRLDLDEPESAIGRYQLRLHLRLRRDDRRDRAADRSRTAGAAPACDRRAGLGHRPVQRDDRGGRRPADPQGTATDP
jgi:type III pantothenate kinase